MASRPYNLMSLCAGVGGLELGVRIARPGARGVCYLEREVPAAARLVARMQDGSLHPAPIWSDLTTFDGLPWRGIVDCLTSGDPCQPNSVAGKGLGKDDDRWLLDHVSASSMKFGLLVSSARTSLGTRTDSLRPSSRHWKEWVTALRLEYSQRAVPEPATSGSAFSSWPTATANMVTGAGSSGRDGGDNLQTAVATWPTPMAGTPAQNGNNAAGNNDFSRRVLEITQTWSTPRASDGEKGGPNQSFGAGGTPLPSQAAQWETPSVAVTAGSRLSRGGDRSSELLLTGQAIAVSAWPTPAARDHKGSGTAIFRQDGKSRMDMLDWKAERGFSLPPVPTTPLGSRSSDPRRISLRLYLMLMWPRPLSFGKLRRWAGRVTRSKLNPSFVDWMHGWPSEWTDCEQAVTGFRPWLLRSRGELSKLLSPPTSGGQLNLFD